MSCVKQGIYIGRKWVCKRSECGNEVGVAMKWAWHSLLVGVMGSVMFAYLFVCSSSSAVN